jgi:hypothetical protein
MNTHTCTTKQLRATLAAMPKQIDIRLDIRDLRFLTDFVKNSGFYIEDLERCLCEDQIDFWQTREHALRILTDWMLQRIEHTATA